VSRTGHSWLLTANPLLGKKIEPDEQGGWTYSVSDLAARTEAVEPGTSWLFSAIKRFKPTIAATLGFSLLGNLAALALPDLCHLRFTI